ncbi:MAG TPA: GNAT family N-acetyltransferase [Methanotrichaceae archaeon]|nr:GNAT family N-acetyltransferase [Methanotrichaceae archaeon]
MAILPNLVRSYRRSVLDMLGGFLSRDWKKTESRYVAVIDNKSLNDVIAISERHWDQSHGRALLNYSRIFKDTFYVLNRDGEVVGYCLCCIRPSLSLRGLHKISVICSFVVREDFRGKGAGKMIMKHVVKEMRLNSISSLYLYVKKENLKAINLYEDCGFKIIDTIGDICLLGSDCYKMELKLSQ